MPLPYEQLTQILGIEASDYPPEHETTPEFMNQKFNELLVNDKELLKQINVLKKIAYTTQESYFIQGETVLDFATKNSNSTKFVIAGITPSDLPISSEGWVSVESEIPSSARKRVVFKPYLQGRYEYYRELFNGEWRSEWKQIVTVESGMITLNGFAPSFTQCKVSKVGNVYTFNFSIVTTGAIPSGTVIATLPTGFHPTYNFHIHPWAYNADVSYHLRAWITTDGNIQLHGGETLQPDVQLEFSRTMIFE